MKKFSLLLTAFLLQAFQTGQAIELPRHDAVPGGVAVIKLRESSQTPPSVHYKNNPVMVVRNNQHWLAIIGIPISAKSGDHKISVENQGKKSTQIFSVANKEYESQYITIKDKRKVNPNEEDLKRIRSEKKEISASLAHWQNNLIAQTLRLDLPVEGRLSSPYGLKRFFNNQPRKPHSGVDIAAPKGTPLKSPANGKVITTGEYFFNGNTVFIDHGQGLVTMYCHMDRIDVKAGQSVKRGEAIGTIGMTGRVTGPHVHWSISLNDVRVDPNLFVPDLQNLSEKNAKKAITKESVK